MSLICGKCGPDTIVRACDTASWAPQGKRSGPRCALRESHGLRRLSQRRGPKWRLSVAIPDFQSFMLPVLELAADGKEHTLAEAREGLAQRFGLTDAERAELLPSGRQRRFDNRVAWAKVHLRQAGLLSSQRRAYFQITQRGRDVL